MEVSNAPELNWLLDENRRLKYLVAELSLGNPCLKQKRIGLVPLHQLVGPGEIRTSGRLVGQGGCDR